MADQRVADLFSLTCQEAFVLAAAKWWLMSEDLRKDPDLDDRVAKRPVVLQYGVELHRAFQLELGHRDDDVPEPTREALLQRMRGPEWPAAVRRSLGDADYDTVEALFSDWTFVASLLKSVTSRERAVLLTVELACLYPWPPNVKYEPGVREKELAGLVDAMAAPISRDYINDLDQALATSARKLARKKLSLGRLGLLAGGGAVLVLSGGLGMGMLAAMTLGGAGGYAGATAVGEASTAFFGNPLAAGGYNIAGDTLNTTTTAAGGGAGATLTDLVKIEVLTEYYLIRERNQPDLARAVVVATEKRLRQTEAEMNELRAQVDQAQQLVGLQAQTAELLQAREAELEEVREQLEDAQRARDYQQRELERLRELLGEGVIAS